MTPKNIFLFTFLLLGLVACAAEPVEVTRLVEREVEVTRVLTSEVEVPVTEIVEVELIEEIEVTREVTVEVEVTRLVEVEVTAVPTETPPPTPTNTPAPAPTADTSNSNGSSASGGNSEEALLQSMIDTKANMERYGSLIDAALRDGFIDCEDVVNTYDAILFAPTYVIDSFSAVAQNAYGGYRAAIEVFAAGAFDMTENCRNFLADPSTAGGIGPQQWGMARQEVNNAVDIIHPAIQSMGGEQ